MQNRLSALILFLSIVLLSACQEESAAFQQVQKDAYLQLEHCLHQEVEWIKVHAAEYLIDLQKAEQVEAVFKNEHKLFGEQAPYRIGIWRVLTQVAEDHSFWLAQIIQVAQDSSAVDQLHAIETLAKRQHPPSWMNDALKNHIFSKEDIRMRSYTKWALASSSYPHHPTSVDTFHQMLTASLEERRVAAYAIFKIGVYPKEDWEGLAKLALSEPQVSKLKVYLLAAALRTAPDTKHPLFSTLKEALYECAVSNKKMDRYLLCEVFAYVGNREDLPLLEDLLYKKRPILADTPQAPFWDIDISSAAAYAILKIGRTD